MNILRKLQTNINSMKLQYNTLKEIKKIMPRTNKVQVTKIQSMSFFDQNFIISGKKLKMYVFIL